MKTWLAAAILLMASAPASAHRLDEYLQATLISIERNELRAEITLTPGVAAFPIVAARIDTNSDGVISESEQRAYAGRVLRDLSIAIDDHPVTPRLVSVRFPNIGEMKEGMAGIRIEVQADLPAGGRNRRVVFENRHQSAIGAYLVNCLVPRDPDIRIVAQSRNESQSVYRLDYAQAGARNPLSWWLGGAALLLVGRIAFMRGADRLVRAKPDRFPWSARRP